jgi:XTP/dITP diphosphohydrolase
VEKIAKRYGINIVRKNVLPIEIQSDSLEEIAKFSVEHAYSILHSPCFVEDAGIFILALNGFPGPYSKFVFKTIGNDGVLKLLRGVKDRRARFSSAVGYFDGRDEPKVFSAHVIGEVTQKPRGNKGFGFDPIFVPRGSKKTFAEMSVEEKNEFSHRAKAITSFFKWFKKNRSDVIR